MSDNPQLLDKLSQIIDVLTRLAPPIAKPIDAKSADCFVWDASHLSFQPVKKVNRIDIELIKGVDQSRDLLMENTKRFAQGFAANNVLLWGARGMGKSSLIKSAHAAVNLERVSKYALKLIEIQREDIDSLPQLMAQLKNSPYRFILFCDDLSFDHDDTSYKSLKAALDGGIEGRPDNVLFYATSNRRHLMPRDMIDNERSNAINPSEAIEEKVSLSDRFGLWLGFHKCSQDDYLTMIFAYATHYKLAIDTQILRQEALAWATTRGNRSGRVAWQFMQDIAGRLGKNLH